MKLRAAVASFETAAAYGLEFPGGTDMDRVRYVADVDEIPDRDEGVTEVVFDAAEQSSGDREDTGDTATTDPEATTTETDNDR